MEMTNETPIQNARAAAGRLADWLLCGPVQMGAGAHAGGVVGTLDDHDRPSYVYGEITGYYLHWLASPHLPTSPRRAQNADAAMRWVQSHFDSARLPDTRIYLHGEQSTDWRSEVQFCFDLSMLIGGMAAATRRGLIAPPLPTLSLLADQVCAFADHGRLTSHRASPSLALPQRWSTQSGPFLVKAASRILAAQSWVPLDPGLVRASVEHVEHFEPMAQWVEHDPLHPTLYFLEGLLERHPERGDVAALVLNRLLAMADTHGNLPESRATPEILRADIIAQALRIGVLLAANGNKAAPSTTQLDLLAAQLVRRVEADGAIAFRPDAMVKQRNVWCAMFAEQALSWYASWRLGEPLTVAAVDIV